MTVTAKATANANMIEERVTTVEAKILTKMALGLIRKQREKGNNTMTTALRERAKEKALKEKEKGNVKRGLQQMWKAGLQGSATARQQFDRFRRQRFVL